MTVLFSHLCEKFNSGSHGEVDKLLYSDCWGGGEENYYLRNNINILQPFSNTSNFNCEELVLVINEIVLVEEMHQLGQKNCLRKILNRNEKFLKKPKLSTFSIF